MKIPLIEGRAFSEQDNAASATAAIVDEEFVRRYFPGEDPIGKLVANNGEKNKPYTVVGVVGNVLSKDLAATPPPEIYLSDLQFANSSMFAVARVSPNVDITAAARQTLRQMDSDVALFDVETMGGRIQDSVKLRRFIAWLVNSFALVGLLLAALGLYGTLAHLVELRRREIAIRMALGASRRDIRVMVARHSLWVAVAGLLPGILLSLVAARAARSFFFGVTALDPWIVGGTIIGFLLLALMASWNPVRQASRVDALVVLREE